MEKKLACISLLLIVFILSCLSNAYSAQPTDADPQRAEKANQALKQSYELLVQEIPKADLNQITSLILDEKREEVEKLIKHYQTLFEKDARYELSLVCLINNIDFKNLGVRQILDQWVKEKPSYLSYGLRGVSKEKMGFEIRGTNYINETNPKNLERMVKLHSEAKEDLLLAVKENKNFLPGYLSLIAIEMTDGSNKNTKFWHDRAVQFIPQSFYVRSSYMHSLRPRWGGSYEQMREYTKGLSKEIELNPQIWTLKGYEFEDQASLAYAQKNIALEIKLCTRALEYGDDLDRLQSRAAAYIQTGQLDKAIADCEKILHYTPWNEEMKMWIKGIQDMKANPEKYKPNS